MEYDVSIYALASRMSVNVNMLTMRLDAYLIKLPECLWVKVGLFELEQLIEIRVLAYLRVANYKALFKTNGYATFVSKLGDLVYTCLLCA